MWTHYWGLWWLFPFGFFLAFAVFVLAMRLLFFRRFGWGGCGSWRGYSDADSVLRRRLAAGEISEADYERLRDLLRPWTCVMRACACALPAQALSRTAKRCLEVTSLLFDSIVLFVHVLSAMAVFVSLALEWVALSRLQRHAAQEHVADGLLGLSRAQLLNGSSSGLVILTGIYLAAAESLWRWGWPIAALLGMVLIGAIGGLTTGRVVGRARRAARAGSELPGDLRSKVQEGRNMGSLWVRVALAVGIVYLMTAHPLRSLAYVVIGIAIVIGLMANFAFGQAGRSRSI